MTYVCITGNESNPEDLRRRIEKVINSQLPLVTELRLDYLGLNPRDSFKFLMSLPEAWVSRLVITQRLAASGPLANGKCRWDIPSWQNWWREVWRARPWYAIDLDWLVIDELANESLSWVDEFSNGRAFFSLHGEVTEIEAKIDDLVASANLHKAGVKIAAPVRGARNLAQMAKLSEKLESLPFKVKVAMGQAGRAWRWSRLAGNLSYFVYDQSMSTAQGQDTFENVKRYLKQKNFPDLYILWSTDPLNKIGETHWNRVFEKRHFHARYFNIACSSEDFDPAISEVEKKSWASDALCFMNAAKISGASVTRPFKQIFPKVMSGSSLDSINTIYQKSDGEWGLANTDASALLKILNNFPRDKRVVLIGAGGTANGVIPELKKSGRSLEIWKRNAEGNLPPLQNQNHEDIIVSTWPAEYQDFLVTELDRHSLASSKIIAICDAQLRLASEEAPLALWAQKQNIPYIPGTEWWKEQARGQEKLWGLSGSLSENLALPRSKSQTIRALFGAAICGGTSTIFNPAKGKDVKTCIRVLESLGVQIRQEDQKLIVKSDPKEIFATAPREILEFGECGAVLRFFMAFAAVFESGTLLLNADEGLRRRPMREFFDLFNLEWDGNWPLEIPCGQNLPENLSLESSSQFASGCILAGAALLVLRKKPQIIFGLDKTRQSYSYLKMTLALLSELGFIVDIDANQIALQYTGKKQAQDLRIDIDASGAAFLECIFRNLEIASPLNWANLEQGQGDGVFLKLLDAIDQGKTIELQNCPDLFPPIWSWICLGRKRAKILGTRVLAYKESDRGAALEEISNSLQVKYFIGDDSIEIDATNFRAPSQEIRLSTQSDHRIAMAIGVLEFFYPNILPEERESVAKSFPDFWLLLQNLKDRIL